MTQHERGTYNTEKITQKMSGCGCPKTESHDLDPDDRYCNDCFRVESSAGTCGDWRDQEYWGGEF